MGDGKVSLTSSGNGATRPEDRWRLKGKRWISLFKAASVFIVLVIIIIIIIVPTAAVWSHKPQTTE